MDQKKLDADIESLREELEAFKAEKEKIRAIIGQIGGQQTHGRERLLNITFLALLAALLLADILRHVGGVSMGWLPPMVSLELGVLLVSLKIIWMIHKQTKVEHFQFWILNSIEFRLNDVGKKLGEIEKRFEE